MLLADGLQTCNTAQGQTFMFFIESATRKPQNYQAKMQTFQVYKTDVEVLLCSQATLAGASHIQGGT
jgi:hypothetical protein